MKRYFTEHALLPGGWARDVGLDIDDRGDLVAVQAGVVADGRERLAGPVLPGMPNLHSHAFQRAMAGLTETRGAAGAQADDDFWSWRELMYRFVGRLTPESVRAIAQYLYIELLKSGYTAVAEFHYVHNAPDGQAYAERSAMALAHLAAARAAGIALTLMPSLYGYGNFGAKPLTERQLRFRSSPDSVLAIVDDILLAAQGHADYKAGVSPHSLRAVDLDGLQSLLGELPKDAPLHIHVAEQVREVEDCLAWHRQRPVEWLLEHLPVDRRWCLVHATHLNDEETAAMARSGAIAGLCPTTEANLGDGIFPMLAYRAAGGAWGIGSDSQVSRSPFEELRLLEYVQRLVARKRNLVVGTGGSGGAQAGDSRATGTTLWQEAARGGAVALARPMGALEAGRRADLVVLEGTHTDIEGRSGDDIANSAIFSGSEKLVRDVMVGGQWQVRDGRHAGEDAARRAYRAAVKGLLAT